MDKQSNRLQVKCIRSSKIPRIWNEYEVIDGQISSKLFHAGRLYYTKSKSKVLTQCHLLGLFLEPFCRSFVSQNFCVDTTCFSSNTDAVAMKSPGFSQTTWCRSALKSREDSGQPAPARTAIIQPSSVLVLKWAVVFYFSLHLWVISQWRGVWLEEDRKERTHSHWLSPETRQSKQK